ncbi:aldehyde dehydrogenase family protein [Tropicimonas isoalkanivorans]|uniref:aldehyde dehydrogenase (NAD(+)) n=1 Tax=Tropicimonas isoalkanivorans TaxID=441112 RepID=A0A1I1HYE2_9RHOB|nr:aldehyde dehydrogenase family protein [Tropicimonas isoalkanivorans]SFC28861.1 betaine-aldehyde dehydrogenase [Tropicimonas isoalkanivorans]
MNWTDRGHFINGRWTGGRGGTPVENPFEETTFAQITAGTTGDIDAAVAAARAAFPGWAATPPLERAALVARVADGLKTRMPELAEVIATEVGTPIKIAGPVQVGLPMTNAAGTAKAAESYAWEREIGNSRVVMEPVGVVAAVTPWNYPLHQAVAKVAPAIVAGCTVVLKPADLAPLNALMLAEIFEAAGAPPGVFNVVTGPGRVIGEHLATHPGVDMLSFTGSTGVGGRLAALAARDIRRVSLELGGKSAAVVLDDAELEPAVKATVNACLLNSGQTCSALTRLIVPAGKMSKAAEIAAAVAGRMVLGDPMDPGTRQGPVISSGQRDGIRQMIRAAESEARLVAGGSDTPEGLSRGYFVRPTIFAEVHPDSALAQEEVFGPVLAIFGADDEDDAIAIANNSRYGLSGAVWSGDRDRAERAARRMRTGQVEINGGRFNPAAPFGGFKQSGYGREIGVFGIDDFVEPKALQF